MKIISLMYHDVVAAGQAESSGFPGAAANLYKLERATFDAHLASIAAATPATCSVGSTVIEALAPCTDGGEKASRAAGDLVLLTFDDGGVSGTAIADRLEAHGWRGHFFITTDYVGKPGFLTEADIKQLHSRGHVIGSHSCSHPKRISKCSRQDIDREWRESVARLTGIIDDEVQTASVPGGFYSRKVAEAAAEAGIRVLFNSEPTARLRHVGACQVIGRFAMERMNAAAAARLAAGRLAPRVEQAVLWQLKKAAKAVGGRYWLQVRGILLNRRGEDGPPENFC